VDKLLAGFQCVWRV